ncbi:MAG: superoxide dismutase [Gammaproteobacteria bacterium]|nr:superoxide dismutase [Gammaproteobacteria bacterium]
MPQYTLPDLPYDFGALEPHVSAAILELHHGKHHKAYVDGANKVLEQLDAARRGNDAVHVGALERMLAFHVSGHVLHSLFWENLSPKGGGEPTGELLQGIQRDFGDFRGFRQQLTQAASTIMGSGWAMLAWEPVGARLLTLQVHDHQSSTAQGAVPLLVFDAWEHAYYLQYRNEKAKFFEALWNVVNWGDVAQRYTRARPSGRH